MAQGGPATPIQTSTKKRQVMGGPARRLHVLTSGAVEAGAAIQVYEVTASELAERGLSGGEPLRASLAPGRLTIAGPAIPVYVVSGSLGPAPTPPAGADELLEIFADNAIQGNQTQGREEYWEGIIA